MITGEEVTLMIRKLSIIIVYGVMAAILFLAVRADLQAIHTPQVPATGEEMPVALQPTKIQDAWIGCDGGQTNALILMSGYRAVMISYDTLEQDVSVRYTFYHEGQMTDSSGNVRRQFVSASNGTSIATIETSREGILHMNMPDGAMIPAEAVSNEKASGLIAKAQEIQNGLNQGGQQNENQ